MPSLIKGMAFFLGSKMKRKTLHALTGKRDIELLFIVVINSRYLL